MSIILSNRVQKIKASPTLAITAQAAWLRAQGKDIIGLGAGEPDFDTPKHIKEAAISAIQAGFTKYTPVDGTPELKQAIINKFQRDNALHYTEEQILVSCGAKQGFYNLCQALINPGDEVVIPSPYWVSYPDGVLLAEGVPVYIPTDMEQRFKITAQQLDAALTDQSRLVILNSPSNPTGIGYTQQELQSLGAVLEQYPDVWIITDDIYEHIYWCDKPFSNIVMACPNLLDRTVVLNGVSKAYAMTGWRIGYVGGPVDIIRAMKKIQSQSTSNPTSIAQVAAQAALEQSQSCIAKMVDVFKARHDQVVAALGHIPGVTCLHGDGTFYTFVNAQSAIQAMKNIQDDLQLSAYLIDQAGVAVVPGSAFGASGYFRMSFAIGQDKLDQAIDRIAYAFDQAKSSTAK